MSGLKLVEGTVIDTGIFLDGEDRIVLSPEDTTHITEFITLVVAGGAMTTGDALGGKIQFDNLPRSGVIHSIIINDAAKQSANIDVYFYTGDIVGTADHDPFAPTDIEQLLGTGVVLVDTWKANSDSSIGSVDNIGLPYNVPSGTLYVHLVTRGTPTYVAATDVSIRLGIVV